MPLAVPAVPLAVPLIFIPRIFGTLFSACNCLLTSRNCLSTSRGSGAYCILNSPKRVPAVYWFLGIFLYPWGGGGGLDLSGQCPFRNVLCHGCLP